VRVLVRRIPAECVLLYSPLVELLNIPPKDLWANSDMFYKQVTAERTRKDKLLQSSSTSLSGGGMSPTTPTAVAVASRNEQVASITKSPKKGRGAVGKAHRVAVPSGTSSPMSVSKSDATDDV
jgi:hypothetical protein